MCAAAAREGPSDVEQKPSDLKNEQANPKKETKHKKRRKTAADAEATLTPEEHERRERQRQRQQEVMQVKPPFDCTAAHSGCRTTVAEVPVARFRAICIPFGSGAASGAVHVPRRLVRWARKYLQF